MWLSVKQWLPWIVFVFSLLALALVVIAYFFRVPLSPRSLLNQVTSGSNSGAEVTFNTQKLSYIPQLIPELKKPLTSMKMVSEPQSYKLSSLLGSEKIEYASMSLNEEENGYQVLVHIDQTNVRRLNLSSVELADRLESHLYQLLLIEHAQGETLKEEDYKELRQRSLNILKSGQREGQLFTINL